MASMEMPWSTGGISSAFDIKGTFDGLLASQMAWNHLSRHVYTCGSLAGCPHCIERDMHLMHSGKYNVVH